VRAGASSAAGGPPPAVGEPAVAARLDEPGLARWGRALGAVAVPGRVFVALYGPLGAGKTTLVRSACEGGGIGESVTSPTFTLVQRYEDGACVHHVDLYRIERARELFELGWDDLLSGDTAVFVEWADRAWSQLPPDRWDIRLSFAPGGGAREVEAYRVGAAPPIPLPPSAGTSARTEGGA